MTHYSFGSFPEPPDEALSALVMPQVASLRTFWIEAIRNFALFSLPQGILYLVSVHALHYPYNFIYQIFGVFK